MKEVIEIDDDTSMQDAHFQLVENKPRRIIFCIDTSAEMAEELKASANTGIRNTNLYHSSRMESIQRFLKRFANINAMIGNRQDQYALITLAENATWWFGFDTDIQKLSEEISFLDSEVQEYNLTFDIKSIFSEIEKNADVCDDAYFYHVIVIYARTDVMPYLEQRDQIAHIRDLPNFVMDLLFLHDASDKVQDVYDLWDHLDSEVHQGWYYESGPVTGKDMLTRALAELIAHPLQRGNQEFISR
ncbi:hypothetical protein INT47_000902 [Mucor saturninus]|uniref:BRISC and BRCA1-A complex member 1 n=1 Tax=Mucor saturninus TaxID=64648 RepID=A0A8H7RNH3_9FUNG|nr:hypothetical protein INT47_000902 [Mucor saturninus]